MANAVTRTIGQSFRNVGQTLNVIGNAVRGPFGNQEALLRTRRVNPFFDKAPAIQSPVFLAPSASVVGAVTAAEGSSIWYNSVVRAEKGAVNIGGNTHIQERVSISSSLISETGVEIGDNVIIEPGVVIQACTIEAGAYIGAGAVLLEGCTVKANAVVGPGFVVNSGETCESDQVYAVGAEPRPITPEERQVLQNKARSIGLLAKEHEEVNSMQIERLAERTELYALANGILHDKFTAVPNYVKQTPFTPNGVPSVTTN